MATIQHSTLAGSEIHEPKGIASAPAGYSYISDGAGSGAWEKITGYEQFQDTNRTVGTPTQVLTAGAARTKFICDGGFLTSLKPPSDATVPFWDTVNNKHVPISDFDTYALRISFTCENYAGTNPYIQIELDIGGSIGVILSESRPLLKSGAAQDIVLPWEVFTGTTYSANGGTVYLSYVGTGTCDIYNNSILIRRTSREG